MKIEELEVYNPEYVPGNFKSLVGFETEHLKVISRAPNKGKFVA